MTRLALLLPLALASCASDSVSAPLPGGEVRPVVTYDDLKGRWIITSVNGRQSNGLALELGGEGLGTVTRTDRGTFVESPQPPTGAYLGCNHLRLNGWTREGDKLTLGIAGSTMTERGCDPSVEALETQAYAILRNAMTMEFTAPKRLRLTNANGTLELISDKR